jgi:uncharacterized protein with ParB-like and HNH nuclease domain
VTAQTIRSEDLAIGDLFRDFFEVPDYQREYVWTEENVEQLLQDIYDEFSSPNMGERLEYFLGSIVVCPRKDGVHELIDGQQRMTTCYLVLCGVRDYLKQIAPNAPMDTLKGQIAAPTIDENGADVYRFRVALQYEDSRGLLERIAKEDPSADAAADTTTSVANLLAARRCIAAFLRGEFADKADDVRRFHAFFTRNVKMIRIGTESVSHALRVFETINDRGVGLDSMDLLKNLLFMSAKPEAFSELKTIWKRIVDNLFDRKEKPLRFLRYFIFSEFDVDRLKEEEIYDWFVTNEHFCGYRKDPLGFARRLETATKAYCTLLRGTDPSGQPNRYLANIQKMSGAARQHLILLLAGRRLAPDVFLELCRQVENLFFAYIVTRQPTRDFERLFASWAREVRSIKSRVDLDAFVAGKLLPAKKALSARFELAFKSFGENSVQKYRLRYVLAKLTQLIDERAWGSSGACADIGTYINAKVEIEHVLPRTPSQQVTALFDKMEAYYSHAVRLGNLALIEKTINCSIGHGTFGEKRAAYSMSSFLLTKAMNTKLAVGKDTAFNRAVAPLEEFNAWQSADIDRRQAMLARLAFEAWDMPQPPTAATASS